MEPKAMQSLTLFGTKFEPYNTGGGCMVLAAFNDDGSCIMIGDGDGGLPLPREWLLVCYETNKETGEEYETFAMQCGTDWDVSRIGYARE